MIDIESYIKEGIVFSLSRFDYENLKKGPSLFQEVTDLAQEFYIEEASKDNAIIQQFADEASDIKKPFSFYLEEAKKEALDQKIYVVIDKNTTLFEFWNEIGKLSFEMRSDVLGTVEMPIRPMFLWCKGIQIDIDALYDIVEMVEQARAINL